MISAFEESLNESLNKKNYLEIINKDCFNYIMTFLDLENQVLLKHVSKNIKNKLTYKKLTRSHNMVEWATGMNSFSLFKKVIALGYSIPKNIIYYATYHGETEMIKYAASLDFVVPKNAMYTAFCRGHIGPAALFLKADLEFYQGACIKAAINYGHEEIVIWYLGIQGIKEQRSIIRICRLIGKAALAGRFDLMRFFIDIVSDHFVLEGNKPSIARGVIKHNRVDIFEDLNLKEKFVVFGAFGAIDSNSIQMLEYIKNLGFKDWHLCQQQISHLVSLETLQWLYKECGLIPSEPLFYYKSLKYGCQTTLGWIYTLGDPKINDIITGKIRVGKYDFF